MMREAKSWSELYEDLLDFRNEGAVRFLFGVFVAYPLVLGTTLKIVDIGEAILEDQSSLEKPSTQKYDTSDLKTIACEYNLKAGSPDTAFTEYAEGLIGYYDGACWKDRVLSVSIANEFLKGVNSELKRTLNQQFKEVVRYDSENISWEIDEQSLRYNLPNNETSKCPSFIEFNF